MSVLLTSDAIGVGRDPLGATWVPFGRSDQWQAAKLRGVVFDPSRGVLELQAAPAVDPDDGWVPLETVTAPDGTRYRSDPDAQRVLRAGPCDEAFTPIPNFGGRGSATGQLRRPLGLALDRRGRLYVADADNHRVQVVDARDGQVVYVFGSTDIWGRPVPRAEAPGMVEPVDVALDEARGLIYMADRAAGLIRVFDAAFKHCRSFSPEPPVARPAANQPPRPFAIAVDDDGSLLVADARWPRLLRVDARGTPVGQLELAASHHPRFAGLRVNQSFSSEGYAVIGPLDSGIHAAAWHRVFASAETQEGTRVTLQTFASDDVDARSAVISEVEEDAFPWAPELAKLVPLEGASQEPERDRLVLSSPASATDCGRYLWIRIGLYGALAHAGDSFAVSTPKLGRLRALFPRYSYLRMLPSVFARRIEGDPAGAVFPERFLALFEAELTRAEQLYEQLSALLNPEAAPEPWLSWLASFLALSFDPSWTPAKRRALLLETMALYRRRGTAYAIKRYLEIYTGREPALLEGFALRAATPLSVLGSNSVLGCAPLSGQTEAELGTSAELARGAHHFSIVAYTDDRCQGAEMEPVIHKIVESEKPAHTAYDLSVIVPDARVGLQSLVGIDFVLGQGGEPQRTLGQPEGDSPTPPLLGRGNLLGTPPTGSAQLDDATRLDGHFNLA